MPGMQIDWEGLIALLAESLYTEKRIFIRELVQNAHDAIIRRQDVDRGEAGRIDIITKPIQGIFVIRDNGIGMSDSDLHDFLSTIGIGATRVQEGIPGLIGKFGIGFLSAFIVATQVTVETRKLGTTQGWRWINTGSREYCIEPCAVDTIGTTVTVQVKPTDTGVISAEEITSVVKTYADWLQLPIFLNASRTPLNRMIMPWERDIHSTTMLAECDLYVAEISGGLPLELIPIRDNKTSALLYITKSRVIGVEAPRSVRVFVKRMLISKNLPDILPQWASFVNGVINSDALTPTAARDNIAHNEVFNATREELGNAIIAYLEELKTRDPRRFSEIQQYHWFSIKCACYYLDTFFDKFVDLLEWSTNVLPGEPGCDKLMSKARTLGEILSIANADTRSEKKYLRCFGGSTPALFFQMATASATLVIDASKPFEMAILKKFVQKRLDTQNIEFIRVDHQEDPLLFRMLGPDEAPEVVAFARRMQEIRIVQPNNTNDSDGQSVFRLTVEVRRFAPASLPALLRPGKGSEIVEHALDVLDDPNSSPAMKKLAQSTIDNANANMILILNANNSLILKASKALVEQKEAANASLDRPKRLSAGLDLPRLIAGIYNSAFLSSDTMNERNTTISHENLVYFMDAFLDTTSRVNDLNEHINDLNAGSGSGNVITDPQEPLDGPRCVFMMTPFSKDYDHLITALRIVVEDLWGCELVLASDRKLDDRIYASVRKHIARADLFIAELTEGNPNVMFELGSVFASRGARPIVTLARARSGNIAGSPLIQPSTEVHPKPKLPKDVDDLIYVDYGIVAEASIERLAEFLDNELRKDDEVQKMLADNSRPKFVSLRRVCELVGNLILPQECRELCRRFRTLGDWADAMVSDLKSVFKPDTDDEHLKYVLFLIQKGLGVRNGKEE